MPVGELRRHYLGETTPVSPLGKLDRMQGDIRRRLGDIRSQRLKRARNFRNRYSNLAARMGARVGGEVESLGGSFSEGVSYGASGRAAEAVTGLRRRIRSHGAEKLDVPYGATNPLARYPSYDQPETRSPFARLPLELRQRIMAGDMPEDLDRYGVERSDVDDFSRYGRYSTGTVLPGGSQVRAHGGSIALIGPQAAGREGPVSPVAPMGREQAERVAQRSLAKRLGMQGASLEELRSEAASRRQQELARRKAHRQVAIGRRTGNMALVQRGMRSLREVMGGSQTPQVDLPPIPMDADQETVDQAVPRYISMTNQHDPKEAAAILRSKGLTPDDIKRYYDRIGARPFASEETEVRNRLAEIYLAMTGGEIDPFQREVDESYRQADQAFGQSFGGAGGP